MKSVRTRNIVLFLSLVSILTPQGAYYFPGIHQNLSLFGLLWTISFSTTAGLRFQLTLISSLAYTFPLLILSFPFIYQIIRYCQGLTGKRSTVALGIILTCPILFITVLFIFNGMPFNFYPVPILLIVGLFVMQYLGPKPPATPWDDINSDH
jgi:hypothetical protein